MGTLKQAVDRVAATISPIAAAIIANGGTVSSGDGLEEFATDINTITANIDTIVSTVNTKLKASLGGKADLPTITVSAWANGTITLTSGGTTKTVSYTGTPIVVKVEIGDTWTVSATIDGETVTETVTVSDYTNYTVNLRVAIIVTRQVNFTNNTSPVAPTAADLAASPVYTGITRCNVSDDGTITANYGDSGYTEDGSNGQIMVKIPKFWYKLETEATSGNDIEVGQWYISDKAQAGYKLHPAFINANGNEVDYFLIGAFENTFQNGSSYTASYGASYKMASVGSNGGTSIKPGVDFTCPQGRACASARGTGWYQIGFKQIQAVQMLFGVEFGFNSQYTVGQGYTDSGNSASTKVGQTTNATAGDTTTSGSTAGDLKPVCWRGIENLWGNVYSWIEGFICNSGIGYFKNDYNFDDTYSSSTYTQIGFTLPSTNYPTHFGYDLTNDWILFPHSASSSPNKTGSIGDHFYLNTSTNRRCFHGGYWASGTNAGLFYFYVSAEAALKRSDTGSRLMYVPTT